jgi:hypothetical protein
MPGDPAPLFVLTADNGFAFSTSAISNLRIPSGAQYNQQAIMNRSSSIVSFSHSDNNTLSVTVHLMAMGGQLLQTTDVQNIVKGFLSLRYPTNPGIEGPPVCNITIGAGDIVDLNRTWVCTNVDPDMTSDMIFDANGRSYSSRINLSFLEFELNNVSTTDWAGTGTLKTYTQLAFGT